MIDQEKTTSNIDQDVRPEKATEHKKEIEDVIINVETANDCKLRSNRDLYAEEDKTDIQFADRQVDAFNEKHQE
jgi:uracil-DNA glycosylase